MSGGSFDYLYEKSFYELSDEEGRNRDNLEWMIKVLTSEDSQVEVLDALNILFEKASLAKDMVKEIMDDGNIVMANFALEKVEHAVEWARSGDWSSQDAHNCVADWVATVGKTGVLDREQKRLEKLKAAWAAFKEVLADEV